MSITQFSDLSLYLPANFSLWDGRRDTEVPERLFQKIKVVKKLDELKLIKKSIVFIGFASDAGVVRNHGRPGARQGPDAIKTQLARLPCSVNTTFIDLGSIVCDEDALEEAQQQLSLLVEYCQRLGHFTVVLGGGHEIAWGHYQGLAACYPKLGIINFDAHFDLRPYKSGQLGSSGTPFSQISLHCTENNRNFDYCCVGIQKYGNTVSLFKSAQDLNVSYLSAEDINSQSKEQQIIFLDSWMQRTSSIYLTICLDVFNEAVAPGVSAPQPLGLNPWQTLPLLKYIVQSGKVVSLDVAELSPPLDHDNKTARLAALIISELLNWN